jgi:preprotein translocase subunit YajC
LSQALRALRWLDWPSGRRNYNAAPPNGALTEEKENPVFISNAYAQSTAANGGAAGSLMQFLPLVLMFVVLYFIMIRPQMKRQKEHRAMIDALAKGDEVVIGGGVIGRVAKLGDSVLHVEVAKDVEIQVQRSSVVQLLPKGTYK